MPEAVHRPAAAAMVDRVCIAGGYTDLRFSAMSRHAFGYNSEARTWAAIADLPAPARRTHGSPSRQSMSLDVGRSSENVWVYDPATDRWDGLSAPLPTRREHLAAAVLDNKLLVVGGRWGDAGNLATLRDLRSGRWPLDARPRHAHAPQRADGWSAAGPPARDGRRALSAGDVYGAHEVYDLTTDRWTAGADLPTPRHGLASAVLGDRWYLDLVLPHLSS